MNLKSKKKPMGFGSQVDGRRQIIDKKKPGMLDAIQGADANSNYGATDSANTDVPEAATVPAQDTSGAVTLTADELRVLVARQADEVARNLNQSLVDQMQALQQDFDTQMTAARHQQERLQTEAQKAADEATRLKGIFTATGTAIPVGDAQSVNRSQRYGFNVNTMLLPSSAEPQGAAKDFYDIFQNPQYTPRQSVFDSTDGSEYEQIDTTYLDRYIRTHKDQVMSDMERLFKAHGYLRGSNRDATQGSTLGVSGSIQNAFLPFLSAIMRMSHVPRYIWWQFVTTQLELGRVPGNNILVPRFQWLDDPTDPNDFIVDNVSSSATFSQESQALSMLTTPIELFGYALGKGTKVTTRPIAIPEFISASSLVDLVTPLNSRLGQNYNALEDLIIRQLFEQTLNNPNNIYYNNAGTLSQTSASMNAGSDGTATEEAFNALFAEMTRRQIPLFPNGTRVGVLNGFSTAQFKNSLGGKLRATSEAEIQEVTSILNAGTLGDGLVKPSGYLGNYDNFMLFESGTISIGATGTEGVQNTTFGVGTNLTRDNYFFGPGVVGKGVSMPMEIRMDESNTFGTKMRFIWRSIEGWGTLDCTSTNPSQQDRVLVLRTTDRPM